MKDKPTLTVGNLENTDAWPEAMKVAFDSFVECGHGGNTHVLLVVCVDIETKALSTVFSPAASLNPHKVDMCKSMADMFQQIAQRGLSQ